MAEIKIKDSIYIDIKTYCEANSITDMEAFFNKIITFGFTNEKFGFTTSKENKASDEPKKTDEVVKKVKKDIYGE